LRAGCLSVRPVEFDTTVQRPLVVKFRRRPDRAISSLRRRRACARSARCMSGLVRRRAARRPRVTPSDCLSGDAPRPKCPVSVAISTRPMDEHGNPRLAGTTDTILSPSSVYGPTALIHPIPQSYATGFGDSSLVAFLLCHRKTTNTAPREQPAEPFYEPMISMVMPNRPVTTHRDRAFGNPRRHVEDLFLADGQQTRLVRCAVALRHAIQRHQHQNAR